jgi:hypothetical protein
VLEIPIGVVRGDDRALVLGDLSYGRLDLLFQCLELPAIRFGIGPVGVAAGCIGGTEGVGDILHIDLGIMHRLPCMGIGLAVTMVPFLMALLRLPGVSFLALGGFILIVVIFFLGVAQHLAAFGQFHDRRHGGARHDKTLEEALELEPVDQHHVGRTDGGRVSRLRFVNMGVTVRPDQRDDVDTVAADILGEIGDDRETGDNLEILGRCHGQGGWQQCYNACRSGKLQKPGHSVNSFCSSGSVGDMPDARGGHAHHQSQPRS